MNEFHYRPMFIQGFVKVAGGVQPGESPVRSRNCRARRGSWAQRRVSLAKLVTPCMRNRVMTRLARADQIWGAFPVRMRDLSSFQITSRSFSGDHAGDRQSDPRVRAAQRLLLMMLPCATRVVQVLAPACHRVLGLWLMRVISSRLAARAAASSSSRSLSWMR